MIVSGDVLIRATDPLQPIPEADVVCYGLWLNPETASHHGVFVSSHERPDQLERMLQKPSVETLSKLSETHFYLTDIGVWLLSDRAVRLLMKRSEQEGKIKEYDLYSEFGCALGSQPDIQTRSSTASGWRSSRYRVANFTILARPTNSSPRPWRSKISSTTNGRSCTTR